MKWSVNVGDKVFYGTPTFKYIIIKMNKEGYVTLVQNEGSTVRQTCFIKHSDWILVEPEKDLKEQICDKIRYLEQKFKNRKQK
jgi:hypothetical protein